MIYDVGDKVTKSTVARNESGTPINTPTLVLTVTKPDATTSTPAVTNTASGGLYTAQVTFDQAGLWTYAWTASGTLVAVDPDQDTVTTPRALVASMQELKQHLNRTDVADDQELRSYLVSATNAVEYFLGGPVSVQTFTEVHCTYADVLVPRRLPLVAVTSITPYLGSALTASAYSVDTDTGVIRLRYSAAWYEYTLVYTAGYARLPENAKLAGLIIGQHLWETQNGFAGRRNAEEFVPGLGFAIPNRARDMLTVTPVAPGFA